MQDNPRAALSEEQQDRLFITLFNIEMTLLLHVTPEEPRREEPDAPAVRRLKRLLNWISSQGKSRRIPAGLVMDAEVLLSGLARVEEVEP